MCAGYSLDRFYETIRLESRGLEVILEIDEATVSKAVALILGTAGKVVVTGVGKSGLVGEKMTATFASTGTPALFVHASEASHGDMGMIGYDDVIIMLSNSGETKELFDVIQFAQAKMIPIIGITRNADSALARNSEVAILIPPAPEACPLHLAPTTSTTQMLAIGDALAVTVMEIRGFTPDDFAILHPGGSLGRLLATAQEVMHTGEAMPIVRDDVTIKDAISAMMGRRFGCIGVINRAGALSGIVSDGDLRRHLNDDLFDQLVSQVMTEDPFTIGPQMKCLELLDVMNDARITVVFVVDDDKQPIGIIDMHDLVRLSR